MRIAQNSLYIHLFVLLCLFAYGCDNTERQKEGMTEPMTALEAYTTGVIGRLEPVYVIFAETPDKAADKLLTISPERAGTAKLSGNSLSFSPTDGWAAATDYKATVALPDGGSFTFNFSTPERLAEIVSDGFFIASGEQNAQLTGSVVTNDVATVADIQALLAVEQDGKALDVEVLPGMDRRHFTYRVKAPDRGAKAGPVRISATKTANGFTTRGGDITVKVPSADDFRVESVTVLETGDKGLLARFTGALDSRQDLAGMIQFEDNTRYTTRIDGNLLYIYPATDNLGETSITLDPAIKGEGGVTLGKSTDWRVNLGRTEPLLRSVGEGVIVPHAGKRLFAFEAIGLTAVRLEVLRIFSGNVGRYLQEEDLSSTGSDWSLRHVGKIVAQKRVELSSISRSVSTGRWTRYAIDLDEFIEDDASAIYQVRLGFGMADAAAGCTATPADFGLEPLVTEPEPDPLALGFSSLQPMMGDYYGIHGYYADFNWRERDNPCVPGYYNRDRFLIRNVLSSNLGLIAKRNPDRSTVVFTTDLRNASPFPGTRVRAFSAQNQELFSGTTDDEGRVVMTTEEAPVLLVADVGQDVAYLSLDNKTALNMSRFETSGASGAGGVKGAFYAERGVWRPGDSVYLNFVLTDKQRRIPDNYPVTFTLTDARGRVAEQRTVLPFGKGFYALDFATDRKDATGNWRAMVEVGGRTYTKNLMIETIKPNRLSIDLEQPAGGVAPARPQVTLVAKWLYGAPASNLKYSVSTTLSPRAVRFDKWQDFRFNDPARNVDGAALDSEGSLDEAGAKAIRLPVFVPNLPGPVYANVSTKVFEEGGNFSVDNQRIAVDPFKVYAGIRVPKDEWGFRRVGMDRPTNITIAAVDPDGNPVAGRKLTAGLYRVNWRYWWQDNNDNVARFNSSRHTQAIKEYKGVSGADGAAKLAVQAGRWGRYLLRVCDEGGHCTGQYFYAGYNEENEDRESAALLRPVAERETVSVGEQVNVKLPTSAGGRLLVSLETGAGSIEQFWVDAEAGQTSFSFEADARMVPTVYANVTLLQPYEQTTNDRPARLYGVVPVEVTDPATLLNPEVVTSDEWAPKERVTVKVSESAGQPMTYTLAVVDEGLLGLTRFKTPDLHDAFFAKEALSVRSYDLYKYVLGSLNGEFGKVLAIGGGDDEGGSEEKTANRFEPVVRYLGPFRLAAGKTATHELTLPNYVGAVRAMVVAHNARAYGSVDKRIPVVQPLMVLPTLPRVLGPGERVDMPVNVFAMKPKVKNVTVDVAESSGLVSVAGGKNAVNFSKVGNQTTYVPLQVGERTGIANFTVTGRGNGESASQEIEIDIRQPNATVSRASTVIIAPGESQTVAYDNFGVPGSRGATVELSTFPAMQLDRHLKYLLRYPYGCVEQTVSPAFAQLFLDRVTELTTLQDNERKLNVAAGLSQLRKFQTSSGGMGYWPGRTRSHPWASNYALHFLAEAERAGFGVPVDLKTKLIRFQQKAANDWRIDHDNFYVNPQQLRLDQAYRLYVLALCGQAELGAMNRLRGQAKDLPTAAAYQLAAAYALAGQAQTATDLLAGRSTVVKPYHELGYTFGSDIRDMAMILEAQVAAKDVTAAGKQALRLAKRVGQERWLSTQEAAFAFVAIGKVSSQVGSEVKADFVAPGGGKTAVGASTGIYNIELPTDGGSGSFRVTNTGTATLYATVITEGKPAPGDEKVVNSNLSLNVRYTDDDGNPLDVTQLTSGTSFTATYTVSNPGSLGIDYRQLALSSLLPSGWEVSNDRLDVTADNDDSNYDFRDFRDDRVFTFFDLPRGSSKTFSLRMTATYPGRYYLPGAVCEAMYAGDVSAGVAGQWVLVGR